MARLTTAQADRAAGVLLGQACGDALGVPYELARPPGPGELAEMRGGGLGNSAPGEWSDDTAMAVAVADGLAAGPDLATALDEVATRFLAWYDDNPPDVGVQTRAVLSARRRVLPFDGARGDVGEARDGVAGPGPGPGAVMAQAAADFATRNPRSAGNGALMRTSPVALFYLHDRAGCAEAARGIASLTHADPLAGDSCVLWSEAIRVAVLDRRRDVAAGLDLLPEERRASWRDRIDEALAGPASRFIPNGFTVTALQAALAAVAATPESKDSTPNRPACLHFQDALHAAVRIGHDTDTVAAIAGGLLGAYWGASAVPWRWRRTVHGWPFDKLRDRDKLGDRDELRDRDGRGGRDARDLTSQATLAVRGGKDDNLGWPSTTDVAYDARAAATAVPHPENPGVLLGTHRSRGHGATAVVSLCRVGRDQGCFEGASVVVESRLMDSDDPAQNPNLAFALYDAADAVRGLRDEGHTVLVHCVAAEQRTPSVAIGYSMLLGKSVEEARQAVRDVLASTRGTGRLWDAAGEVKEIR